MFRHSMQATKEKIRIHRFEMNTLCMEDATTCNVRGLLSSKRVNEQATIPYPRSCCCIRDDIVEQKFTKRCNHL